MIVKIKCKECEKTWKIKRKTVKEARITKKEYRGCLCEKCVFKVMARNTAKQIVRGVKCYDNHRQIVLSNL